ncbi:MAG: RIP metalloprotease RseP [Acidobacteria bacterium]|nr:MAG: RIP metalloprotease RseP [Acidobacteriota bacterium]
MDQSIYKGCSLSYAFSFLLVVVPLVLFHELGHFIVAKLAGIRVNTFAFGFGKELFSFHFKGTDYRWNLIPLGGYVDLFGEVSVTGEIPEDPRHFYNRPKWVRFLVMVMGPLFNILLAFIVFWYLQAQPKNAVKWLDDPITVGYVEPDSAEAKAGLQPGDHILAVNGVEYKHFEKLSYELAISPEMVIEMEIERDGKPQTIVYTMKANKKDGIGDIQFTWASRLLVQKVIEGSPAERAGLQAGDWLERAEGQKIFFTPGTNMLFETVQARKEEGVVLVVNRSGERFEAAVVPEKNDKGDYLIGVQIGFDSEVENAAFLEAGEAAWQDIVEHSTFALRVLKKMVFGDLSVKAMSGPIGIGQVAKESLDRGLEPFIFLLALLSLQLGIFNLIPIPMLDGGEIFVLLIEGVTRRDFSLGTKVQIKMAGFFFLISFVILVLISDVMKLFV